MKATDHHLVSLDVFRGVTIAAMILVNNPGNWGAVFEPLEHSAWNGCRVADLVFPAFLFIMGMAMPLAFARRRHRGATNAWLFRRIGRRTVALVGLGLLLNMVASAPHMNAIRTPGVLQRIALAYAGAGCVIVYANVAGQTAIAIMLMLVHWALLALVPFGGHPAATMTQAANLDGYINQHVFGTHMLTAANDPEGLLGTLSATATVLMGGLAGQWLRTATSDGLRLGGLLAGGAVLVALGLAWSVVLPLNKPLWTGSYALLASGVSCLAFASFYWSVDARGITQPFRPFIWLGANPLAIYFLSELVGDVIERPWIPVGVKHEALKELIFWRAFAPLDGQDGGPWTSLAFAVCFLGVWVAVAGALDRHGVRLRV